MLSTMESHPERPPSGRSPADELGDIRRGMHRVHLAAPPTPSWVWPTFGFAAAIYTWSFTLDPPANLPVMVCSLAITFGVLGYLTRRRGNFPSFSAMPSELRREAIATWIQVAALAALVIALWHTVGATIATLVAGVAFAIIMFLHQRRHEAITHRLASRVDGTNGP